MAALCHYLVYRIKKDYEETAYRLSTHKHLNVLASTRAKDPSAYLEEQNYNTIYRMLWEEEEQEDKRSAQQIVNDTFRDMGIKIIKGGEPT